MKVVPDFALPFLQAPIFAHLATVRPDNTPQVNPMWFLYGGNRVKFTHTKTRGKYRNLRHNPGMAFSLLAPDNPYAYIEVRGTLSEIVLDPGGEFYLKLAERYGQDNPTAPPDADNRVILVMRIDKISANI